MRTFIEYLFNKNRRIGILQGVYIFFELTAIFLFSIILIFGLVEFLWSIKHFFSPLKDHKIFDFDDFIKGLLSSFEIFFLAPIPLLIIASFKRIVIKMFPVDVKIHPSITKDMISEIDAKKTFISSLIGVTSTLILGQFIEIISWNRIDSGSNFSVATDFFFILILSIAFLFIQIFLYSILSKFPKEKE